MMKKHLPISLVFLHLLAINVFGQDFKKIVYQFDAGMTISIPYETTIELWPEVENHPITNYQPGYGYFMEVLMTYHFNQQFALTGGVNYNYNALQIDDKAGFIESKGNITNSYLTIPVLFKYRLSSKVPISVSAGPYVAFLLSANEKGTSKIDSNFLPEDLELVLPFGSKWDYDIDVSDSFEKTDFGLAFELNYDFNLNQKLTGVLLSRFNYGLTNVLSNNRKINSSASHWQNYNLLFGFGIKI